MPTSSPLPMTYNPGSPPSKSSRSSTPTLPFTIIFLLILHILATKGKIVSWFVMEIMGIPMPIPIRLFGLWRRRDICRWGLWWGKSGGLQMGMRMRRGFIKVWFACYKWVRLRLESGRLRFICSAWMMRMPKPLAQFRRHRQILVFNGKPKYKLDLKSLDENKGLAPAL